MRPGRRNARPTTPFFLRSNIDFIDPPGYTDMPANCRNDMPRYRGTSEGTPVLVGRLLLLVAAGPETSATLAAKLGVTPRQVNRYVRQLNQAGWRVVRRGVPTRGHYHFELVAPRAWSSTAAPRRPRRRRPSATPSASAAA